MCIISVVQISSTEPIFLILICSQIYLPPVDFISLLIWPINHGLHHQPLFLLTSSTNLPFVFLSTNLPFVFPLYSIGQCWTQCNYFPSLILNLDLQPLLEKIPNHLNWFYRFFISDFIFPTPIHGSWKFFHMFLDSNLSHPLQELFHRWT